MKITKFQIADAMKSKTPFHIIHLSDLHLTPKDDVSRSEPNILGALKGMNQNFRQLIKEKHVLNSNLILVTGDVTDRGDIESWEVFWDGICDSGLQNKTLVIPGNHDLCCLGIRAGFRKNHAQSDKQRVISGLEIAKQKSTFPWAKKVDERVVIFGLDSNNAGNYGVHDNATGRIGFDQFLKLGNLLRKYESTPVKIVCLHHSPNLCKSETAAKRDMKAYSTLDKLTMQMKQEDRQFLRVLCNAFRVRLILHGHLHKSDDQRVNSVRIIGSPASTEPINKKNEFQFFEYIVRGNGGRVNRELRTIKLPKY